MKTRKKIILGILIGAAFFVMPWYGYCNSLSDMEFMPRLSKPKPWQTTVCFGQIRKNTGVEILGDHGIRPSMLPEDEVIAGKETAYRGDIYTQYYLAKFYYEGGIKPPDYKEAYYWFSLMEKTDINGNWKDIPACKASAAAKLSAEEKKEVDTNVAAWQAVSPQPPWSKQPNWSPKP